MKTLQNRSWQLLWMVTLAGTLFTSVLSAGELRFSRYFSDGMVIQRDKPVTVSGFAEKGAEVTVSLARSCAPVPVPLSV